MREYENFLKRVKEENQDEYNELNDIVSRYNTLSESNKKLKTGLDSLNKKKEVITVEMANYIKEKKTQRMTITNDIGEYQKQLEKLEDEKGKMQTDSEETKLKSIQGTSEIGKIIMSIENLKEKFELKSNKKTAYQQGDPRLKNFDDLEFRGEHSIKQLEEIEKNIIDMQKLVENLEKYEEEQKKNKVK